MTYQFFFGYYVHGRYYRPPNLCSYLLLLELLVFYLLMYVICTVPSIDKWNFKKLIKMSRNPKYYLGKYKIDIKNHQHILIVIAACLIISFLCFRDTNLLWSTCNASSLVVHDREAERIPFCEKYPAKCERNQKIRQAIKDTYQEKFIEGVIYKLNELNHFTHPRK